NMPAAPVTVAPVTAGPPSPERLEWLRRNWISLRDIDRDELRVSDPQAAAFCDEKDRAAEEYKRQETADRRARMKRGVAYVSDLLEDDAPPSSDPLIPNRLNRGDRLILTGGE